MLTDERRRAVCTWLRSKSFASDIVRETMTWAAKELEQRALSDQEILAHAEQLYARTVELPSLAGLAPTPPPSQWIPPPQASPLFLWAILAMTVIGPLLVSFILRIGAWYGLWHE